MVRKKVPAQKIANNEELDISLQDVANGVEDELLVIDKEHHINFANLSVQRHFQKEAESLIGKTCYQVLYNRDKPCASPLWQCPCTFVLPYNSCGWIGICVNHIPFQASAP